MRKPMKQFFQKSACGILCAAMVLTSLSIPGRTVHAAEPDAARDMEVAEQTTEPNNDETTVSNALEQTPDKADGVESDILEDGEKFSGEENEGGEPVVAEDVDAEEEISVAVPENDGIQDEESDFDLESEIPNDRAATGTNYLSDPSFESGNLGAWTVTKSEGAAAAAAVSNASSNNKHEGNYSLHFWNEGAVGFTVEQTVKNLAAGTYKFGGYIIGEDKDSGKKEQSVYVEVYNSTGVLQGERKTAACSIPNWDAGWQNPEITGIEVAEGDYLVVGMKAETAAGGKDNGAWGDIDDFYLCADETEEEPTEYNTTVSLNFYYGDLEANASEELGFYKWGDGITQINNTLITSWGGWGSATKNPVYKMTPVDGHSGWFNVTYTANETITLDENSKPAGSKSGFSIFTSKDSGAAEVVSDCSGFNDPAKHPEIYVGLLKGTITAIMLNSDGELVGYATIEEADEARKSEEPEDPKEDKVWTFEELTSLIGEAEQCNEEDYTAASWKAFASALDEAKKITGESGEEAITAAYEKLGIAKNTLAAGTISIAQIALADDFITGADLSSYYSLRQSGVVFKDEEGNVLDDQGFFNYLAEGGTNWVRIRVWNNPFDGNNKGYGGGNNDINVAKELGKLATNAGMRVLIDFHYSDFWADPGKQKEPKAWSGYTLAQKVEAVETYTKESLQILKDAGVDVGMVQVGNETTNKICGVTLSNWSESSQIFNAGSKGVRAVYPNALVAIHFTNPERGTYGGFAKNLAANNVDYDVFASSYYPFWHGTLENLTSQLANVAKTYNKKVMVAETSWATTLANQDGHDNTVRKGANDTNKDYGYSVQGQADELRAVVKAVNDVNETAQGMGIGVFYWEPAWISKNYVYKANGSVNQELLDENKSLWEEYGSGWASSFAKDYDANDAGKWYGGSAIDNQAWFDFFGNALPTAKAYKYIRTGETAAEMAITGIESPEITIEMEDKITYPDEVTVSFNDASKVKYPVNWNVKDQAAVDTSTVGEYTVKGTVTCEYKLNNGTLKTEEREVVLTIIVKPQVGENILSNPGFEDGKESPWAVAKSADAASGAGVSSASSSNMHSGKWSLHFYNAGVVGFTVQQTVTDLNAGTYTFGGYAIGEDKTSGEKEQIAFVEVYDSEGNLKGTRKTATFSLVNFDAGWQNPEIRDIEVSEGDYLVVGMVVETAAGGAWGDIDDLYLYGLYDIAVDEKIEEGTGVVSVIRSHSVAGKTIDITAAPETGYMIEELTISGAGIKEATDDQMILQSKNGTVVQVDGKVTLTYPSGTIAAQQESFKMPNSNVVIGATFKSTGEPVNKTGLNDLIAKYEDTEKDGYTEASWKDFADALAAAKDVSGNADATQLEVNKAATALEAAYKGLKKQVDKTLLNNLITECEGLEQGEYTDISWAAFQKALEEAKAAAADENASQSEVDAALEILEDAKAGLKKEGETTDFTALEKLLAEYKAIWEQGQGDYTDESWEAFTKAWNYADGIAKNENATQAQVDKAVQDLTNARNKLVETEPSPGPGEDTDITVTFYYPDKTIKTVKLEKNAKLVKPEFDAEDTNGKYGIIWYADEAKTEIYDFDEAVTEDISLYGTYYYYYEETGKDESGAETVTPTGIWVERIDDQQYTGAAIKPVVIVYDGTTKLQEKVDYKVSYSNNKKVSTAENPAKVTITPCGNYEKASKFSVNFNINKREITKENVTLNYKPEMNVKYNKQKAVVGQTQKVSLKYGKLTIPAKEYDVEYYKKAEDKVEKVDKLTEAGDYQLVIKTKDTSSFSGDLSYDIVVTDKILVSALKFKVVAQDYSGQPLTPDVNVTYKGKSVVTEEKKLSDIFEIEYKDNINAGTASVTLTAKADSDYYGSRTVNFKINGTAIKKAAIEGFQSTIAYTGDAVEQNVQLILNKNKATARTLVLGKDYEIAYSNNTNAGKATMTITGMGEFSGTVKKTFTVGKINLKQAGADVKVEFVDATQPLQVAQDKSGAEPAVRVTYKGSLLVRDKDYKVTYSGNKAVGGNAKVTVKGIGNYAGDLKNVLSFEITAKDISDESIAVVAADLKYAANGRYKAKLTVYDNGVKLSSGEYTVGNIENVILTKNEAGEDTQCGTAEVTLTGKKNYTGEKKVTVQIRKTLVSSAKITVNGTYYYANGDEVSPTQDKLVVTIGSGKNKVTLTAGEDFIIESCTNNTRQGKATLTIRGIGEYGGTKSVKYKILPKWMRR